MKKTNIIKGVVSLSVLALLGGGLAAVNAQTSSASTNRRNLSNSGQRIKPLFRNKGKILTEEQKSILEARRAKNKAERDTRQAAVKTAIANNNYQAWVEAVGSDNPIVKKITSLNFSQFIKAYNLRQEARQIMTDLGLEQGGRGANFQGRMMNNNKKFGPGHYQELRMTNNK